jgi:hypothetical protein
MEFNRHDPEVLEERSELAHRLKRAEPPAAAGARVEDIPFPDGLSPTPQPIHPEPKPGDALPKVDVIAMMDTSAESEAMAHVLTPGHDRTTWYPYARNFETHYLPLVGPRGPSRASRRLGSYFLTTIGRLKVLVYKTELHMHPDALKLPSGSYSLPIKDMLAQMIDEARPDVFLTTGTSGGVYCAMHLGDVVTSRAARFHCQSNFAEAPFNNRTFTSDWTVPTRHKAKAAELMQGFASHLANGTRPPDARCACGSAGHPTRIHYDGLDGIPPFHPILTTDFFEFGTSTNNLDKLGMAVEMDDAVLGLACAEMKAPPRWACVRNLSDPCINGRLSGEMQSRCAEYYYEEFGYWTTVMGALTTWGIVAGLADER